MLLSCTLPVLSSSRLLSALLVPFRAVPRELERRGWAAPKQGITDRSILPVEKVQSFYQHRLWDQSPLLAGPNGD